MKTGALVVLVTARGDTNASSLAANIGIGDGSIVADGRLENLAAGTPTGAMALNVNHPDMVAFVRTFANDYRPALGQAGPFELKSELALQPEVMTLSKLEGRAGPVSYNGNARVALGGVRPNVTAQLQTSEIIVDWFLPAPSQGGTASARSGGGGGAASGGSSSGGGQRWSRERLDLSALSSVDADVSVATPAITYTDIKVEQPQLAVTVKDGVLNLNRLSGNAFGGGFNMTAQVADREVPTMQYALKVEGADAAKFVGGASSGGDKGVASALELLFPVSDLNLVSGTLGADLKVASRGRSESEMISNLGGDGAVQFTNAVVEGVDVCAISNRLDNIDGFESLLALAAGPKGGQTKIAAYNGRFDIVNGVATFPQQTINPDCATVTVSGQTNLPQWTIAMRAQAAFPAHPEFPGLIVEQSGSLDAPNTRLVNLNALNQFIAGKAAGTALRKLAPDIQKVLPKELDSLLPGLTGRRSQPQQTEPATNEQQQAPAETQQQRPADPFQNLLEGLIRR
ncbi:MAG: AsmA family protein [Alphaproteobacteria bacterium]|nr:AsmA family protein [Alphaproteobacteria bacterium]